MKAHLIAKDLYLTDKANSALSVLQGLHSCNLISSSESLWPATKFLGHGLGQQQTCACLTAAIMAAGLSSTQVDPLDNNEDICAEIFEAFRDKYQTTTCAELTAPVAHDEEQRKQNCGEIVEFVTHKMADLLIAQAVKRGKFSLIRFTEYLNSLPPAALTSENVHRLMTQVQLDPAEIEKCLVFSPDSYARNLFYKNDRFEILVMCWNSHQVSQIHDHDQSFSVERIVSGQITNTIYQTVDNSDRVIAVDSQILNPGEVISNSPGDIHKIETTTEIPAVSIHLYSPPLKRMKTYSLSDENAQWVNLSYLYIYKSEIWQSLESCNL